MFSSKISKVFKNIIFKEHLRWLFLCEEGINFLVLKEEALKGG